MRPMLRRRPRTATGTIAMKIAVSIALVLATFAPAQELQDVAITGDRLGGFVLPIEPVISDLRATCVKAWSWKVDDTQRLELIGDVRITVASYEFAAQRAFIWVNRLPSSAGLINQIAIWFPEVDEPTRRAGLGASGRDLLITASTRGEMTVTATLWEEGASGSSGERTQAEARVQRHLAQIASSQPLLRTRPDVNLPPTPPPPSLEVGGRLSLPPTPAAPTATSVRVPADGTPIISPKGAMTFFGRTTTIDEATDTIAIEGSVVIDWLSSNAADPQGALQLTADRAVVFLRPGTLAALSNRSAPIAAENVDGIYLEGNVIATDFNFTVRGNRVYYDLRSNQALMVDAVMRTTVRDGLPVTARAAELRQVAADQFVAQQAQVSTSEFFTPHLSIGAERVTVTKRPGTGAFVEGSNATFRVSGTPVVWYPNFRAEPGKFPLRTVSSGYNQTRGVEASVRWDLFNLVGVDAPKGVDGDLLTDLYSENGVGAGTRFSYAEGPQLGNLELYGFYDFENEEQSSAGRNYVSDKSFRGIASADYSTMLGSELLLQTQLNYISDPAFLSTFRQRDFAEHREYETSGYLRWQSSNSVFSILGKYDVDNSVVNSYQLASRPYSVDKLPQVDYARFADELWDWLSWSQEYSANTMQLRVTKGTPASIAAPNLAFFPAGYVAPAPFTQDNLPIANAYTSAGYDQEMRGRVYTRQEFAIPFEWEKIKVTPFANGTAIGYFLDDFDSYSSDADSYRAVAGVGARMSTQFTRVFDGVQSRALDVNRLRWIVQPNGMVWTGYDNSNPTDYPIYDQSVEAISAASVGQIGLTQRLQTYRGGPGNWRSVDWIYLDVGAVITDHNNTFQRTAEQTLRYAQSPLPSFYRFRPEYSQWGSHLYGNASWQMSSTFTLIGSAVAVPFDERPSGDGASDWLGRGSVGVSMYHNPEVSTYVEYRYVNNFDPTGAYPSDELLNLGINYKIGNLYQLALGPQFDLREGGFRSLSAQLVRIFPDFDFGVGLSYDSIVDEYSLNARLRIAGPNQRGAWAFSQATPQFPSAWAGLMTP